MFKKIEAWILYLTIVIAIIFAISFGILVRQELVGSQKLGFVSKTALFFAEIPKNLKIIYLNIKNPGIDLSIHNQTHASKPRFNRFINSERNELLLLARYNGDISRSVVEIIDLNNFSVLHTYKPDIQKINSKTDTNREEFKRLLVDASPTRYIFFHPLILENGDLLFHSGSPLVKIDFCSNLLWVNDVDTYHHSNNIDHEGNYWAGTYMFPYVIDKELVGSEHGKYKEGAITKISYEGKMLYQKSVVEILLENNYKHLIFGDMSRFNQDPIHLNDIQPALQDGPYWKKGDVFLSLRNLSMIMHFRPTTNKIINIITGDFFNQHDVDIISDREISIFNNNVFFTVRKREILTNSEVLIYNFETKKFSQKFKNSMKINEVKTISEGLNDILKDGSMMVESKDSGRILFFNSNGDLEWEYVNKAKNGKIYLNTWSRIIDDEKLINSIKKKMQNTQCTN